MRKLSTLCDGGSIRSKNGKLSFGSGGVGSSNHLASELFKSLAKAEIVHVPYKGASIREAKIQVE